MDEMKQSYAKLLSNVAEKEPRYGLLRAQKGALYDGGLMVVGRCVNGWGGGWRVSDFTTKLESVIESVLSDPPAKEDMEWVKKRWNGELEDEYNIHRSAFWRVIHRIAVEILGIAVDDPEWPLHLVWSNLYKLAPAEGGNPNDLMCASQLDACAEILQQEIIAFKPRRILFLTGPNWFAGFDDHLNLSNVITTFPYQEGLVHMTAQMETQDHPAQLVVMSHPQGKAEDPFVEQAVTELTRQG